jgi:hypothetical protein
MQQIFATYCCGGKYVSAEAEPGEGGSIVRKCPECAGPHIVKSVGNFTEDPEVLPLIEANKVQAPV